MRITNNASPLGMVLVGLMLIGVSVFMAHKKYFYMTHGIEAEGKITKFGRVYYKPETPFFYRDIVFTTSSGQQISIQSRTMHNKLPSDLRGRLKNIRISSISELHKKEEISVENRDLYQKILYLPDKPQEAMVKPENRDFLGLILIAAVGGVMIVIGIWQQLKRTRERI